MVVQRLVKLIIAASLIISAVAIGVGGAAAADNSSFDVAITDINTPVVEGETVVITAKITNRGSVEDSEQIHLKQNGTIVDSVKNPPVTLAPGESTNVVLEWTPDHSDAGPAELAVWSDDHEAVRTIDVGEGPTFPVAINGTSAPVQAGESLTVSVTVRNTGETIETTPVELSAVNELQDQKDIELAPGETKQIDLTWETAVNDIGVRTVEVVSADAATESRERISTPVDGITTDAATETTVNGEENTEATANSEEKTETTVNGEEHTEATMNGDENTDAIENEEQNAGMMNISDPGFGVAAALVALLAVALLGYGIRR